MGRPIAIDLFCGAGGMSLGFEQAGFEIAVAIDFDEIHAKTHQLNFPSGITLTRDLSDISGKDICEFAGINQSDITVVIGGPPCQGFSMGGKRQMDDPRNLALFDFARIVGELQPNYFVVENVEGILMGPAKKIIDSFIEKIHELGYLIVEPIKALNAQDFGVPQRRKRVFILGYRPPFHPPSYPVLDNTVRNGKKTQSPTVWDAIKDLHMLDNFDNLYHKDIYFGELGDGSDYSKILRGDVFDLGDHSHKRITPNSGLGGCRRSNHTEKTVKRFSNTIPGKYEPVSRFYRLTKEGVSNVLRAGSGKLRGGHTAPRPIHPISPRCITVREAARLHSFPDWFQFDPTIWHGFRQVGNSVPPLLARSVAASVKKVIDETSSSGLESMMEVVKC